MNFHRFISWIFLFSELLLCFICFWIQCHTQRERTESDSSFYFNYVTFCYLFHVTNHLPTVFCYLGWFHNSNLNLDMEYKYIQCIYMSVFLTCRKYYYYSDEKIREEEGKEEEKVIWQIFYSFGAVPLLSIQFMQKKFIMKISWLHIFCVCLILYLFSFYLAWNTFLRWQMRTLGMFYNRMANKEVSYLNEHFVGAIFHLTTKQHNVNDFLQLLLLGCRFSSFFWRRRILIIEKQT